MKLGFGFISSAQHLLGVGFASDMHSSIIQIKHWSPQLLRLFCFSLHWIPRTKYFYIHVVINNQRILWTKNRHSTTATRYTIAEFRVSQDSNCFKYQETCNASKIIHNHTADTPQNARHDDPCRRSEITDLDSRIIHENPQPEQQKKKQNNPFVPIHRSEKRRREASTSLSRSALGMHNTNIRGRCAANVFGRVCSGGGGLDRRY